MNVGAIAVAGAFAIGTFVAGENVRTVYSGFPVDPFVLLFGVTYLFGMAADQPTLASETLAGLLHE